MVYSVDHGDASWYYIDPQVSPTRTSWPPHMCLLSSHGFLARLVCECSLLKVFCCTTWVVHTPVESVGCFRLLLVLNTVDLNLQAGVAQSFLSLRICAVLLDCSDC